MKIHPLKSADKAYNCGIIDEREGEGFYLYKISAAHEAEYEAGREEERERREYERRGRVIGRMYRH